MEGEREAERPHGGAVQHVGHCERALRSTFSLSFPDLPCSCSHVCVCAQSTHGYECYLLDDHGNIVLKLPYKDDSVRG